MNSRTHASPPLRDRMMWHSVLTELTAEDGQIDNPTAFITA